MDIKHRSKKANIYMHKGDDPNPLIQAQTYGCRPRPQDLDLHPTKMVKTQERGITRDRKALEAHIIATNMQIKTHEHGKEHTKIQKQKHGKEHINT